MIVRIVVTLAVIFMIFRIYRRITTEKRCPACRKWIHRQAPICHYCNTIQQGVEIVGERRQAVVAQSGNKDGKRIMWIGVAFGGALLVAVVTVWWLG